ncbi:hypothetical protein F4814DRAFT_147249 [Daldinia grandis]|nr:hypothetical protein F4814DRAFT_147249 [Daldinia grandis]
MYRLVAMADHFPFPYRALSRRTLYVESRLSASMHRVALRSCSILWYLLTLADALIPATDHNLGRYSVHVLAEEEELPYVWVMSPRGLQSGFLGITTLERIQFTATLSRFNPRYSRGLSIDNSQMYHACPVSPWTTYSTPFLRMLRIELHHMHNRRGLRMACLSSSDMPVS